MADLDVEIDSPLSGCFRYCEVDCVRECCGIDSISTDAELIANWAEQAGPAAVDQALGQLNQLIRVVEDRSYKVRSMFLNHYTADEAAREELVTFLQAFQSALQIAS
jgi:hypothetical protein